GRHAGHRPRRRDRPCAMSFDAVLAALANLLTIQSLLYLTIGTFVGLLVGVIPGIGVTAAIALLTPLTFGMEAWQAITLMAGIMAANPTSSAVTSILINTPGGASSAATIYDGFPMAKQGRAGVAIGASASASGLGGIIGILF